MTDDKRAGSGPLGESAEQTFEKSLERLERIVEKLEHGDLGLEDGLKLFEEGISISNALDGRLADAEMKVEQLMTTGSGDAKVRPLDVEDDA